MKAVGVRRIASSLVCLVALSSASASLAQEASAPSRGLAERSIVDGRLVAHPAIDLLGNLESSLAPTVRDGWAAFRLVASGEWQAYVDRRTGRLEYAEGAGIPWIPGRGNSLTPQDLAPGLRSGTGVDLGTLEKVARGFVPQVSALLGLDGLSLVLNRGRSERSRPTSGLSTSMWRSVASGSRVPAWCSG